MGSFTREAHGVRSNWACSACAIGPASLLAAAPSNACEQKIANRNIMFLVMVIFVDSYNRFVGLWMNSNILS